MKCGRTKTISGGSPLIRNTFPTGQAKRYFSSGRSDPSGRVCGGCRGRSGGVRFGFSSHEDGSDVCRAQSGTEAWSQNLRDSLKKDFTSFPLKTVWMDGWMEA